MTQDLPNFLSVGREAVKQAEKILLRYFESNLNIEFKADQSPVTIADRQAEAIIKKIISDSFPDHGFYGEESGIKKTTSGYQWTIDPIDGTKNYTRGLPFFTTELALFKDGEVILGISNAPKLGKTLFATKGQGAYLNNQPIKVSLVNELAKAYVIFGGLKYFVGQKQTGLFTLTNSCGASRGFGDAWSYHLLAEGKIDCMVEAKIGGAYDAAAEVIIIEEAGGKVTDIDGNPFTIQSKSVIATNGILHDQISNFFVKP